MVIIYVRISKIARFLEDHEHFRNLPEGYWRDGDNNLINIKNDMSKSHLEKVIKGLMKIQKNI